MDSLRCNHMIRGFPQLTLLPLYVSHDHPLVVSRCCHMDSRDHYAQTQRLPRTTSAWSSILHTPIYNHSICTLVFVVIFSLSHLAPPACGRCLKLKHTLHASASTLILYLSIHYNTIKLPITDSTISVNCKTKVYCICCHTDHAVCGGTVS